MTDELAKEFCVPNERSLHLNVKLESPTTNLKLEQDSQLPANLHSPASPSQNTYLSGTNRSPMIGDLPGTNPSPKKTCVAEPDKYRSKKRNRKAQMLQATIDCVFGLWEKDM